MAAGAISFIIAFEYILGDTFDLERLKDVIWLQALWFECNKRCELSNEHDHNGGIQAIAIFYLVVSKRRIKTRAADDRDRAFSLMGEEFGENLKPQNQPKSIGRY